VRRLDFAVQALFQRRQPRLGRVEPVQRLVDRRQARFGDSRRLGVELTDRLLVRLADRRPLVLQAPLELVDPRRGLVQQPPLDLVPLAERLWSSTTAVACFSSFRAQPSRMAAQSRVISESRVSMVLAIAV
jgi:hypothetical protein